MRTWKREVAGWGKVICNDRLSLMKQYQETKELTEIDVMYDEELARIADQLALAIEEALQ